MKSTKLHCLVSMTKYISEAMDMTGYLLLTKVNYKKAA